MGWLLPVSFPICSLHLEMTAGLCLRQNSRTESTALALFAGPVCASLSRGKREATRLLHQPNVLLSASAVRIFGSSDR